MRKPTYLFVVAMLFGGMMAASCGESPRGEAHEEVVEAEREQDDFVVGTRPPITERELEVIANDQGLQPNEFRVQAGQDLSVELLNQGEQVHNVVFELPSGQETLPENVQATQSDILEFEAPQEAGTYPFYCPVENHREKSEGQLIVEEAEAN